MVKYVETYVVLQHDPIQTSPFSASHKDLEQISFNRSNVPLHEFESSWNFPKFKKKNTHKQSKWNPWGYFFGVIFCGRLNVNKRPPPWQGHHDIRQCYESSCRMWPWETRQLGRKKIAQPLGIHSRFTNGWSHGKKKRPYFPWVILVG